MGGSHHVSYENMYFVFYRHQTATRMILDGVAPLIRYNLVQWHNTATRTVVIIGSANNLRQKLSSLKSYECLAESCELYDYPYRLLRLHW